MTFTTRFGQKIARGLKRCANRTIGYHYGSVKLAGLCSTGKFGGPKPSSALECLLKFTSRGTADSEYRLPSYKEFMYIHGVLHSGLRLFQDLDYFGSYETGQSVGGAKTGEPREKPPGTPASRTWLVSHVASAGLEPTPDKAVR